MIFCGRSLLTIASICVQGGFVTYRISPPNPMRAVARDSDIATDCVGSCLQKGRYILVGSVPGCLRASFLPFIRRLPTHSAPGENARDGFPGIIHCIGRAFSGGPWANAPTPPPSVYIQIKWYIWVPPSERARRYLLLDKVKGVHCVRRQNFLFPWALSF